MDGVLLSESGVSFLTNLFNGDVNGATGNRKKKRDQGILDCIESVIAASVKGKILLKIHSDGMFLTLLIKYIVKSIKYLRKI